MFRTSATNLSASSSPADSLPEGVMPLSFHKVTVFVPIMDSSNGHRYPILNEYNARLQKEAFEPARKLFVQRVHELELNMPARKRQALENERQKYKRRVAEWGQNCGKRVGWFSPEPPVPGPEMQEFQNASAKIAAEIEFMVLQSSKMIRTQFGPAFRQEQQRYEAGREMLRMTPIQNLAVFASTHPCSGI